MNEDILSNDECDCKYCSAIIIIPFGYLAKFYIPLSKKEFNELFWNNSRFLCNITNSPSCIYPNKYIIPVI